MSRSARPTLGSLSQSLMTRPSSCGCPSQSRGEVEVKESSEAPHKMLKTMKVFLTNHLVTPFKEKKTRAAVNVQGREKDDRLRRVIEEVLIKWGSIGYYSAFNSVLFELFTINKNGGKMFIGISVTWLD